MKKKLLKRLSYTGMFVLIVTVLSGCSEQFIVLDSKGPVGEVQANLMAISAILLGVVIIPVLIFFAFIVYRYRDRPDSKASFKPEWDDNKWLEIVWWGIPILVVGILGFYTIRDTFVLAERPAESEDVEPLTIQVTSLDWKWLFLYPEQGVATVNYVEIPINVPVDFQLTTDAPINSFWVPQLGGQKYTLPGKTLQLWLEADEEGTYYGTANNFSGEGFTEMKFDVNARSEEEFSDWVNEVKEGPSSSLTMDGYEQLSEPSVVEQAEFSSYTSGLFEYIVDKNGGQYYRSNETGDLIETEE
ncbi:ubiquinol oxidase subunit II [Bacillus fonticola]|uniref:ubiquinol oxidase subunit II n=1 Tax=Bacillus fonticola TaxID=2728853 RepID=UPI0014748D31|nr:ubiquinol oxidase subunit II [Bacillus fonticola]